MLSIKSGRAQMGGCILLPARFEPLTVPAWVPTVKPLVIQPG